VNLAGARPTPSSAPRPSPPSILRRPQQETFDFRPAPTPVPQRTEREEFGGSAEPFGGSASSTWGETSREPDEQRWNGDRGKQRYDTCYDQRDECEDDVSDDSSLDEPVSSKTRLGAAIHRVNLAPINEDLGPREEMSVEEMFRDIDIFCHYLKASQVDISGIAIPDPSHASYHEVKRVHALLLTLYGSSTYKSLGEEAIFGFASALEYTLDGSVLVFNKFPISYKGLRRNMMTKFRSNAPVVTNAATKIASHYGISASAVALFDLFSPLVTTPIRNMHGITGPLINDATAEGLQHF
jgi:hypothetical protein